MRFYLLSSASGKMLPVNSQNGVVAQAMLAMQLSSNIPASMVTIRKIHAQVYGSGDHMMKSYFIECSILVITDQNFTAPQAKNYLEILLATAKVSILLKHFSSSVLVSP